MYWPFWCNTPAIWSHARPCRSNSGPTTPWSISITSSTTASASCATYSATGPTLLNSSRPCRLGYRFVRAYLRRSRMQCPIPVAHRAQRVQHLRGRLSRRLPSPRANTCGSGSCWSAQWLSSEFQQLQSGTCAEPLPPPRIHSIAVLPFENLSGDPSQEYFADGMTEELITELGAFGSFRVISRTSVMRLKRASRPLPEIAHELGVDGIVEGTSLAPAITYALRPTCSMPLLTAISGRSSYESEMEDVLVVQSKVARSVADAIRTGLTRQGQVPAAAPRRVNPEAYQAYLEGRYHAGQVDLRWIQERPKRVCGSSIELDPTFAPAYSAMANLYTMLAIIGLRPATEVFPLAKAAALKAVELDDGLAEAHARSGIGRSGL